MVHHAVLMGKQELVRRNRQNQETARPENSKALVQRFPLLLDVFQRIEGHNEVKLGFGKWQAIPIGTKDRFEPSSLAVLKAWNRDVSPEDRGTRFRKDRHHGSHAAPQIQGFEPLAPEMPSAQPQNEIAKQGLSAPEPPMAVLQFPELFVGGRFHG
jgi:hypothetical protein